jgi:hypothetical protein
VLASLHGEFTYLRHDGQLIAIITHICQLTFPKPSRAATYSYRGKRADQARNYPFQRILQNRSFYGKDRQRYPLYLTVFWFRLACILQKTVRNTVNLSAATRLKLARRFAYSLCISISYEVSA